MSVPLCRNCRHFKDGKCFSEKIRLRRRRNGSKYFSNPTVRGLYDGCTWAFEEKSENEAAHTRSRFNHERFGGDLIKALHTWALEDQDCDLKHEMEQNEDDPNSLGAILDYWAYDQLVEFVEWLFKKEEGNENHS